MTSQGTPTKDSIWEIMRERGTIFSVVLVGGALLLSQAYFPMLTELLTNASLGMD
jgi:hypothetical protein